ncbi:hypothetical protein P4V41_07325 [Fictibacillus nanhaiensis]|uniref:hypothetical protein n=1 Tax=Fictibacillus nanhaiensis TaxID=742169 RepID=UPI002E1C2E1E|nr:hypothetical protein [Fictibacillus nanhaiensis]
MNEIINKLSYNEKETKIYIPNEIFNDLEGLHVKGSSHVAFAYSFYYLTSWLYRYCKYGQIEIDTKMIKELLGYHPDNKVINYIIKKNGVLDELGYTMTTTDYPVAWEYEDGLEFVLLSDLDTDAKKMLQSKKGKNYKIKVPIKGIWRSKESEEEGIEDGTFYEVDNTHCVPFEVFIECMENDQLGCIGFYLYCYMKSKYQIFETGYDVSLTELERCTGLSHKTLCRYLDRLKKYRMITCDVQNFVLGLDKGERKSNTYHVNDWELFSDKPMSYVKAQVLKLDEYQKMQEEQWEF